MDGASRGFWKISWDTLHVMRNQTRSSGLLSWPYKPVTSRAHLERRKGNDPLRLHVDLEGYDSVVTFGVIKEKLKEWLVQHKGYCIIIGDQYFVPTIALPRSISLDVSELLHFAVTTLGIA